MATIPLITNASTTGAGPVSAIRTITQLPNGTTFQAFGVTTSGSGSATLDVQVSNNAIDFITLGTITLTLGTTSASDGFASVSPWQFVRGYVTSISGTGASVSLVAGV